MIGSWATGALGIAGAWGPGRVGATTASWLHGLVWDSSWSEVLVVEGVGCGVGVGDVGG
jgi:hypothetical protein